MTLLKFYFNFTIFIELIIPSVPIFLGLKNWNRMPKSIKLVLLFLIIEWIIYITSFYLFKLRQNNLFLHYFHSLFSNLFILLSFYNLFLKKVEKKTIIILIILNSIIVLIDYIYFIENKDFNFLSGGWIDLIIFIISTYYFTINFISVDKKDKSFYAETLLISLTLGLQFFIKLIDVFMRIFLSDTQNHSILSIQAEILYSYFMFFSILLYSYVFYQVKPYVQA
jgi:hypothetical protein